MGYSMRRGFAEFDNTTEGLAEADEYQRSLKEQGLRVEFKHRPNDFYLVRWYNPDHYRNFKVKRRGTITRAAS